MRRTPRTRFAVASVAALATFAFAACGGDDDDDTATTEAPLGTEAVEETTATEVEPTDTEVEPTVTEGGADTTTDATSGGGEVGTRDEYVEAITSEIADDLGDPAQAECFAEALVNDDVYGAIQEAGVTVEEFGEGPEALSIDEAQAESIASGLADCGELAVLFGGNEAQTACLTQSLDNEQLALLVTLTAFGLQPTEELLAGQAEVEACVDAATTTTTTTG